MAGIKISALPAVVTPDLNDTLPVVQGGVTKKETLTQVKSLFNTFFLQSALNLSDLPNRITALDNLGIPLGYQTIVLTTDYTFTNPPDFANFFTPNSSTHVVFLPKANEIESIEVGHAILLANDSDTAYFVVKDNNGNFTYVTVNPQEQYYAYLIDNSTSNGTWLIIPVNYLINNNNSGKGIVELSLKNSCAVATTANLTATYLNGTNGFNATLTNSGAQTALVIDNYSPALNERVLVKNQSTAAQNGIYIVVNQGSNSTNWILQRARDYVPIVNNNTLGAIKGGDIVFVLNGQQNATTGWMQTATVTTIGTDAISFSNAIPRLPLSLANGGTGAALTATANNLVYSTASALSLLATSNNGTLITSGTGVPSISSTLPSAVQGNITALGAVTSGSIDSVVIGGSTPAAITGTTIVGTNSTDSSSSVTGALKTAGGLGVAKTIFTGTGISLPTTGGTAKILDFYEQANLSLNFTGAITKTITGTAIRLGNLCIIYMNQIADTANGSGGSITTSGLPARFRPSGVDFGGIYSAVSGGSASVGRFTLTSAGAWTFYSSLASAGFSTTGLVGSLDNLMFYWNII